MAAVAVDSAVGPDVPRRVEKRGPRVYPLRTFYVATTDTMRAKHRYVFGVDPRMSLGSINGEELKYVLVIQSPLPESIEIGFRGVLEKYLDTPKSNIVTMRFQFIKSTVDSFAAVARDACDILTNMEREIDQGTIDDNPPPSSYINMPGVEMPLCCGKCYKTYKRVAACEKHELTCPGLP